MILVLFLFVSVLSEGRGRGFPSHRWKVLISRGKHSYFSRTAVLLFQVTYQIFESIIL